MTLARNRRLVAALVLLAAASVSAQPIPLDSLVRAHATEAGLPSLTVGITVDGQRWTASTGEADTLGTPAEPGTLYEIGSVGKVLTALALADAVARGEATLETPVADLIDAEVGAHADGPIRLVDLATHTSGLPRLDPALHDADPLDPYAAYSVDAWHAFLASVEPASGPGEAYAYSNMGAGLLGAALARHAGTTYAAHVRDRVLAPLGMDQTWVAVPEAEAPRRATPHNAFGAPVPAWAMTEPVVGAGGWTSTVGDMLTLAEAAIAPEATPLADALALSLAPRADADPGMEIGLGWFLIQGGRGPLVLHNGMTGGSASFVGAVPEAGLGIVVLTNRQSNVDAFAFDVLRRLLTAR